MPGPVGLNAKQAVSIRNRSGQIEQAAGHGCNNKRKTSMTTTTEPTSKLITNAGQIMASKLRRMDRYTLDLFPAARSSQ